MIKKISGVLCIIIGGFIGLSIMAQVSNILSSVLKVSGTSSYQMGYLTGQIIGMLVLSAIAFFIVRLGIRLLKPKK